VIGSLVQSAAMLGAGYRIEAAIVVARHQQALAVPVSALFRRDDQWHVFIVENNRAALRALEIGDRNREFAQVLNGLSDGDNVILYPSDLISDGIAVSF
jgi:HlyD family secretion protein